MAEHQITYTLAEWYQIPKACQYMTLEEIDLITTPIPHWNDLVSTILSTGSSVTEYMTQIPTNIVFMLCSVRNLPVPFVDVCNSLLTSSCGEISSYCT